MPPKGDAILQGDPRRPSSLGQRPAWKEKNIFREKRFCFSAVMKGARVEGQSLAKKPASFGGLGRGRSEARDAGAREGEAVPGCALCKEAKLLRTPRS